MRVPLAVVALVLAGCSGPVGLGDGATIEEPDFSVTPESGGKGTVFKVDAGKLGDRYDVAWDFGDGTLAEGRRAEHAYPFTNGGMAITMIVSDGVKQGIATKTVGLGSGVNAKPSVTASASPSWAEAGKSVQLIARGSDRDGDPLRYSWSYRTGEGEAILLDVKDARTTTTFEKPGRYVVRVVVSDPKGGEASAETTLDVSLRIPEATVERTWNGTLVAGTGGAGVSEKTWAVPQAPAQGPDAARHDFTLKYPASTFVMLSWNDTSGQGAFDLDLELRDASNKTLFKSETRAPAPAFEFNFTEQPPGDYSLIVRAVAGANVPYKLVLYASLHLTPDRVAQVER